MTDRLCNIECKGRPPKIDNAALRNHQSLRLQNLNPPPAVRQDRPHQRRPPHAARVLAARGLEGLFDAVYAIEDEDLVAKPQADAYRRIIRLSGLEPARAAMIDDEVRNLEVPKALGMTTVWLCHRPGAKAPAFVDHRITRLSPFLQRFA